jgi:hypothetical protein
MRIAAVEEISPEVRIKLCLFVAKGDDGPENDSSCKPIFTPKANKFDVLGVNPVRLSK